MPRLIALDLGSATTKVASFKVAGRNQVEFEETWQAPVPQDGTPPSLEQRLAALDALLDDHPKARPTGSDVVVLAWPSNEAAFHRVAMPFTDKAQIERTLPFAVENEVPFELDDMVLAWRVAESTGQTQVLAVLSKRERVGEWLTALEERRIDPAAIHVDADLFGPWGFSPPVLASDELEPTSPLVAVVDVGHVHTTISVVRNGVVQYARSVNVAGWTFTHAIEEALGCSWAEAQRLKHGGEALPAAADDFEPLPADVFETDDEVTDAGTRKRHSGYAALPAEARKRMDGAIGLLLAEIRSTLIKAEDTLGGEVAEIRLCGGSARIDELWDYLATDLGVPVRLATGPRGEQVPPAFAVAHALAFASVAAASATPVDLRVGPLAYKGRTDAIRAALGYGLAGAVFFGVAAMAMFLVQYRSLSVEQAEAEDAVRTIVTQAFPEIPPGSLDTMDKASGVMGELTQDAVKNADVVGSGSNGIPPTIDTLYRLTNAFPPHPTVTVELSDLTITPQSISFNAETGDYASSAAVEEALKQKPEFKTATKGQEQRLANGRVRFPITIPLGDAAAEKSGEEG